MRKRYGDVKEWKERAGKHRVFTLPDGTIKQIYSNEEVEEIVRQRDEYKHRADVAERALINMTKKYNKAEQKTATTKDGWFSRGEAQIALLVDDAIKQAEKELAEERKK